MLISSSAPIPARRSLWAAVIALSTSSALPHAAPAQTAEGGERLVNGARFGGWTVSCEAVAVNETVCVLSQRLVRSGQAGGGLLVDLLAFNDPDAPGAWLAARVPNGVHFPSGFALRDTAAGEGDGDVADGGTSLLFDWQSCSPDVCEALLALDAGALDALDAGDGWVAAYRPAPGAEALVFRVSPGALGEGLAALARATGAAGVRPAAAASDD